MADIKKMFDEISSNYDFLNNLISLNLHKKVKRSVISEIEDKPGLKILDLCSGTGDISGLIKEKYKDVEVIGLDISEKMTEIAKKRYPDIKFIIGDASSMPFCDNEFDYVISAFGFRNIEDKEAAINEIKRVLKEKGKFIHLDFGKSVFMPLFDCLILFFAKIFSKNFEAYKYLIKSKNEFLPPKKLIVEFKKAGMEHLKTKNLLFNIISYQIFIR